jgi:ABC-type glycerol-3-phosphate transport system substrate-binding protein
MKNARLFTTLLLAVVMVVSVLPAAAQDDVTFPTVIPDEIAEGREVTITVAGKPSEAQEDALQLWQERIDRFMEQYPNVTIEGLEFAYSPEAFMALVAGGQVPTLFSVFYTEPSKLIPMGVAADLTPLYEKYGLVDLFNPSFIQVVSDDAGTIFGIPGFSYAQGIAYDKTLFDEMGLEPPATWEELAETAQALTDQDAGRAGFMFWNDGSGGAGWHYTNIAYGFGAGTEDIVQVNEDGTYTATFAEGPTVDAMNFIKALRWEYDVLPVSLATGDDLIPALPTGRTAMIMFPGDQLGRIRLDYPDVPIENFGYVPMPAGPEGVRSLMGGSAAMISSAATEDQIEAAFVYQIWSQVSTDKDELIAGFELQNETQGAVGVPVLKLYAGEYQAALETLQEPYIVMPVENYAEFNEAVDAGEVTLVPEPPFAQDWYVAVGAVLSEVLTNEDADVEALMAQAAEDFQAGILDMAE